MNDDLRAFVETLRRALRERYDAADLLRREGRARQFDGDVYRMLMEELGVGMLLEPGAGGAGFGAEGLAEVFESFGWALYDGPYLNHLLCAQALALLEGGGTKAAHDGLAELGAVALAWCAPGSGWENMAPLQGQVDDDAIVVSGSRTRVVDGDLATSFLAPVQVDSEVLLAFFPSNCVLVGAPPSLDLARSCATVSFDAARGRVIGRLVEDAHAQLRARFCLAAAAELTGVGRRCLDMSAEYAKTRYQFGRPIGSFQAVKHKAAEMTARVAEMRAVVAAAVAANRPPTSLMAAAVCAEAAFANAQDCIQIHGGIGFTWEHTAHLFYRRAAAWRALLPSGATHLELYLQDQLAS